MPIYSEKADLTSQNRALIFQASLGQIQPDKDIVNRPTGGFDRLHHAVVSSAARSLEQTAPSHVSAFRKILQQTDDPQQAQNALANIETGAQFSKWREICIDLIDVELQMRRVAISLLLLNSEATPLLSQGEWVDYHYNAWAILVRSLLDKVEKLTKNIVRKLVRPTNPEWKHIEEQMLQTVYDFKSRLKPVRDPAAHVRGPVEAIATEHGVELFVLTGGCDIKALFEPMGDYQHKWHRVLSASSALVFAEIDRLGERLTKELEWNSDNL